MSVSWPMVEVCCDGMNCDSDPIFVDVTELAGGGGPSAQVADEIVEEEGWTADGDSHYCPSCQEDS